MYGIRLLAALQLLYLALTVKAQNATVFTASELPFNITRDTVEGTANYTAPYFPLLPFTKYSGNPILSPNPTNNFESAFLYNPTAIVLNETIFLLYRAQNESKTSTVGLAWSTDGYNFTRLDRPILYPTEPWEEIGGTEDPRIVRVNETFYLTYTGKFLKQSSGQLRVASTAVQEPSSLELNNAFCKNDLIDMTFLLGFNNVSAQLCMATSENLLDWTKIPPLFPGWQDVAFSDLYVASPRLNHSKSGAIFSEKNNGVYHMLHGDSKLYHATSPDMRNWTSLPADNYWAAPVQPWENRLIESGPPPIKTRDGKWLLIYNGMTTGMAGYPQNQYSVGEMLFDPSGSYRPNITVPEGEYQPALRDGPVARLESPILVPEASEEQEGQVNQVVFAEGLVQFKGKWFLYYGAGDSQLSVATADVQP